MLKLLWPPSKWRTLLVLGRVPNLPTVWSDVLAGWCLAGGGRWGALAGVALAASFLYEGGMFLNDAFDADFDRQHRRTRPIPSGAMSEGAVWLGGFVWLALGLAAVFWLGKVAVAWAGALGACILFYNAVHKWTPFAPVLMGMCRLCVYLLAASATQRGVSGEAIWKGLALASYIAGLSCLARKENSRGPIHLWPILLLAMPVVCAGLFDNGSSWLPALVYSLVLAAWSWWALSWSLGQPEPNVGHTVSRLLAGVVLVDLLAVAGSSGPWVVCFAAWFAMAVFLQRFIPAT